jgi:hypothetical protein
MSDFKLSTGFKGMSRARTTCSTKALAGAKITRICYLHYCMHSAPPAQRSWINAYAVHLDPQSLPKWPTLYTAI